MDFTSIADSAIAIFSSAVTGGGNSIISVAGIVIEIGLLIQILKKIFNNK